MLVQITVRVPIDFDWVKHPPEELTVSGDGYSVTVEQTSRRKLMYLGKVEEA